MITRKQLWLGTAARIAFIVASIMTFGWATGWDADWKAMSLFLLGVAMGRDSGYRSVTDPPAIEITVERRS
jgi:hypothetical protein